MNRSSGNNPSIAGGKDAFVRMVENLPLAVMTCDLSDFRIDYVNRATIESLREIEHALPCKADAIVGQCIDIFHKVPSHQRALLSDPSRLPFKGQISLSDVFLDLHVTAIHNKAGRYLFPMLTWSVVTDKVQAEKRSDNLLQMLDEMPLNVMMVDKDDFTITYANKTSIETLRSLEQYLPVRADQLVGSCIDIFHKNPAHQRQLLSDPSNLPHRAKIMVGPEVLDLRVSAIKDPDGTYIGPMLNWTIVTQNAKLADDFEASVAASVKEIANASEGMEGNAAGMSGNADTVSIQVSTVASATEELQASVDEISKQMNQASQITGGAVDRAEQSTSQIGLLAEAAGKIGQFLTIIQDIASQTNLLALNATIEAARAGEAGKGFAVVAAEVKSLASQTDKATVEISDQIQQIQNAVSDAVKMVDEIKSVIVEINEITASVSSAVEEQGAATQEVSRNLSSVSQASEETKQISDVVKEAAQNLNQMADALNKGANEFLDAVKAM